MRSLGLVLVVLVACGSPSKPQTTPDSWTPTKHPKAERTIDQWTLADEELYIGRACANVVGEGRLRCPILERAGLSASRCHESFGRLRASAGEERQRHAFRLIVAGLSLASSCAEVDASFRIAMESLAAPRSGPPPADDASGMSCRQRPDSTYDLSAEDMLRRRGLGDRLFGDTVSTETAPIQVCGLRGELEWLTRLTCADGSRPWGRDMEKAHRARRGSTMAKGRCPHVMEFRPVDLYAVPCPEKTYEVFIDMYECGPGERFR